MSVADDDGIFDALAERMAALKVTDEVRKSHKIPLPDASLVNVFEKLALDMMRCTSRSEKVKRRKIVSFFGTVPLVMAKCWEYLVEEELLEEGAKMIHLLWALHFLKDYSSETNLSHACGMQDEKNFRDWVWKITRSIGDLRPVIVSVSSV